MNGFTEFCIIASALTGYVNFVFLNIRGLDRAETAIDMMPTADVAPKSEVAKEFTCFVGDPHKVEHCPYLDEIEKAKAEVAMEIFEEIEKIKKEYASGDIDGNELYVRLYLLKKKYTEENK